ncbi:MAG: DUF3883 domain-containing protein [Crenarchaeota archaeon]|nr:DUF3883 domain-containing protein [Thermoproteota archaeon]
MRVSADAASVAYTVLRTLLRWHPVYIYALRVGSRPYVPLLHQVLLLHDAALRPAPRLLIGDEVGLGKTAEAIMVLRLLESRLRLEGREPRILILVPRILVDQWVGELTRAGVEPERIHVVAGGGDVAAYQAQGWPPGYYVASIHLLRRRDHTEAVAPVPWDAVVVDEAHNVGVGPSFRSPNRSYILVHRLTREPGRVVLLLSATPHRGVARDYLARLMLLVPSVDMRGVEQASTVLDDREFYSSTHGTLVYRRTKELVNALEGSEVFKPAHMLALLVPASPEERQFEQILTGLLKRKIEEWGEDIWSQGNPKGLLLALIRKRAGSSVYAARRTLEAILRGLAVRARGVEPERLRRLGEVLAASFDELEDEPEALIEEALEALPPGIFTERDIEELRTLVSVAASIEAKGESKLEALTALIDAWVSKGRRVVVFSEYRDTVEYIVPRLREKGLRVECVSGASTGDCSRERIEAVKRRLEVGDVDVVVATDVASEGLNLQAASVLVNYDAPWSPVKLEQRIGRVWRLGQRHEVYIYTLFRDTPADLALVEKLYTKILAIQKAMGTARPMIGSRAEVYAEGRILSVDRLYRGGAPGASGAVAEALGANGEVAIARALIEGRLDEVAEAILEKINRLRHELESKNVYPRTLHPELLRRRAREQLGVHDSLEKLLTEQARRLRRLTRGEPPRSMWDAVLAIRSALAHLHEASQGRTASGTYQSPAVEGKLAIFQARIRAGEKIIYEEPIGVCIKPGSRPQLLTGPALLDKLIELLEKGAARARQAKSLGIREKIHARTAVRRHLEDRLRPVATGLQRLEEILRQRGIRAELLTEEPTVDPGDPILVIEPGPAPPPIQQQPEEAAREAAETPETVVEEPETLEDRLRIERIALQLVMRYELDQGRLPRDVHEEKSYDIESRDPETNEVLRYIEVKAHTGYSGHIELTEREYIFARQHRDKYWLYLVVGLGTGRPKIITIHDPIGKLDLKPVRKRIMELREETRYVAEVDLSSLS